MLVAIWGFIDSDGILLGLYPANDADNVLHLVLGLIGLGAGAATPGPAPRERRPARAPKPARRSRPSKPKSSPTTDAES